MIETKCAPPHVCATDAYVAKLFIFSSTSIIVVHHTHRAKKPDNELAASYAGTAILTWSALVAYLAFADKATSKGAFIILMLIWSYENLRNNLGRGTSNIFKLATVLNLLCVYGMTQEYSETILKVMSIFWCLAGLHMIVDPVGIGTLVWHISDEPDDSGKFWFQTVSSVRCNLVYACV